MVRLYQDRLVATFQRLLKTLHVAKHEPTVAICVHIVGRQRDGLIISRKRLVETFQVVQHKPVIGICCAEIRFDFDGFGEKLIGFIKSRSLVSEKR